MIIMSCSTVTESSRLSDANSSRAMVWQRPAWFGFGFLQGRRFCARPRCIVPSRTNPWSHLRMAWQSFQAGQVATLHQRRWRHIIHFFDVVYSPAQLVAFTTVYKKEYSKKLLRSYKKHIWSMTALLAYTSKTDTGRRKRNLIGWTKKWTKLMEESKRKQWIDLNSQ